MSNRQAKQRRGCTQLALLTGVGLFLAGCEARFVDTRPLSERPQPAANDFAFTPPDLLGTDASPLGTVQRLLEMHLASPMAFTLAHARAAAPWLDAALNKRIAAYFARPRPQDEVPPIDGDPFTNSQEEPERVTLEPGPTQGDRASVVVHLGDAGRQWKLTYRLRRTGSQWRIDDIDNGDAADRMKLSALLRQ